VFKNYLVAVEAGCVNAAVANISVKRGVSRPRRTVRYQQKCVHKMAMLFKKLRKCTVQCA